MALQVVRGERTAGLLDRLAAQLQEAQTDPFVRVRVIVSSPATAKALAQEVARRLGISAGIDYVTLPALMGQLATQSALGRDRSRWLGSPLDLAVREAVETLAPAHPVLARAAHFERPGGQRALATRLARLFRWYLDHSPDLLAAWLDDLDIGPDGGPLDVADLWQPEVFRAAVATLEVDPCELLASLLQAAAEDRVPTLIFALDELTIPQTRLIGALAENREVTALQPVGAGDDEWVTALHGTLTQTADAPAPAPAVAVHGSHGPARQVEVLRDELTRCFAADPTLEPRHVAVVCPRFERYATLLDAAFAPVSDTSHPGRTLRMQPVVAPEGNPVLDVVARLLRLGESRATATAVTGLLLSEPIAHRWRLDDRESVIEIVEAAGVRWGMDASHRADFDLPGLSQNTWMRGLDRLLVGLAVDPTQDSGLGLTGTPAVGASDLFTIGALCELVSRMRRLVAVTAAPAIVRDWVATVRGILDDFVGVAFDDEWLVLQVHGVLARLEADHAGSETLLTRLDFAHLLEHSLSPSRRVAAGNGALQVIGLGDLAHLDFRVVAFLGITDDMIPGRQSRPADALPVPVPTLGRVRARQLLAHGRSAEQVLVITQHRSERTGDPVASATAVTWLLGELGGEHRVVEHPATATAEANFTVPEPSFDAAARSGALARRVAAAKEPVHRRRRAQARCRSIGEVGQQVNLQQLERFLTDPAAAFLRSAAGIALFPTPTLVDELPLELTGLDRWKVSDELLTARLRGEEPRTVEEQLRNRESLPPGVLGSVALQKADTLASGVWREAAPLVGREVEDHIIDLRLTVAGLGEVRLVDTVRSFGGEVVTATTSKGLDRFIRPWLEALVLIAAGHGTKATLVRVEVGPHYQPEPAARVLGSPDPATALARLERIVQAYSLGQHRLIPVPAVPAICYARDAAAGNLKPSDWRGAPHFRNPRWPSASQAWRLFVADLAELFEDPPLSEDPQLGQTSAFQNWALAIYSDLEGS